MVSKRKASKKRLIAAAAFGGLLAAIVGIFPWMNVIIRFFLMVVVSSIIMLFITYGKMTKAEFIKLFIYLYLLTYFLGGFINSIYYHSNLRINIARFGNLIFSNLTLKNILLIFILVIPASVCGLLLFRIINSKNRDMLDIELTLGERSVSTKGLVDTGNCLYDPIFRKPVIIIEKILLKELMPMEDYQKLLMINRSILEKGNEVDDFNLQNSDKYKIKFIPYSSIGKKKGILLALVLDKVLIKHENGSVCNEKVTAAIYDDMLSSRNDYHVILHKELL